METEELKKESGTAEKPLPQLVESDWKPGGADAQEPLRSEEADAPGTTAESAASEPETPAEPPEESGAAAESASPQIPGSPEGEPREAEAASAQAEAAAAPESEAKEDACPAPAEPKAEGDAGVPEEPVDGSDPAEPEKADGKIEAASETVRTESGEGKPVPVSQPQDEAAEPGAAAVPEAQAPAVPEATGEATAAVAQESAEAESASAAAPEASIQDAAAGAAVSESEDEEPHPRGLAPQESLEQVLASIRRRFSRKAETEPAPEAKPVPPAGRTTLGARALLTREQAIGAALALSAAVAAAFGAWCWTKGAEEPLPPIEREDPLLTSKRTLSLPPLAELREGKDEKAAPAEEPAAADPAPVPEPEERPAARTVYVPADVREAARAASRSPEPTLSDLRLSSPLTLGVPSENAGARSAVSGSVRAASFSSEKDEDGLFAGKKTADARAGVKAGRSLRIAKGTAIECVLETRLDTSVPGLASCVLPRDVWSEDGRVLLLEKGSKAVGEYRGAAANGLSRIFLLWTRIVTPAGVAIDLDSPAADPLGGAGIEGSADFHWWARFGNALLFSLVQDAFDFGVARETEAAGGVNYYSSTTDSMTELVKEAMKLAGNIPPTVTKPQGSRITVIAARDLDFRDAYAVGLGHGEEER